MRLVYRWQQEASRPPNSLLKHSGGDNSGSLPLTDHQKFFLFPIHGSLVNEDIQVFYHAKFEPGFAKEGITFARNIYFRSDAATTADITGFYIQTRLLAHEI